MKTKFESRHLIIYFLAIVLHVGTPSVFAQTHIYLFTGSETNITLPPGTYTITAFGATGGTGVEGAQGGLGAEMEGQFNFSASTTLILLVGGGGGSGNAGGGGGGSFAVNGGTPLVIAGGGGGSINGNGSIYRGGNGLTGTSGGGYGGTNGGGGIASNGGGGGGYSGDGGNGGYGGGGGSFLNGGNGGGNGGYGGGGGGGNGGGGGGGYSGGGGGGGGNGGGSIINSSSITNLAEVSGIASPDDSTGNGEIIITAVSASTSPASPEYSVDWFKIAGGGGTSTNNIYSITGTIGQPDASVAMTNGIYSVAGGFWSLISVVQTAGAPMMALTHSGNSFKVSWPSDSTGWTLQLNSDLSTTNWTTSGYTISNDGTYNSITITSPTGNLFFRLKQ